MCLPLQYLKSFTVTFLGIFFPHQFHLQIIVLYVFKYKQSLIELVFTSISAHWDKSEQSLIITQQEICRSSVNIQRRENLIYLNI